MTSVITNTTDVKIKERTFTYSQLLALAEKSARKSISSDLIKYSDDILSGKEDQIRPPK